MEQVQHKQLVKHEVYHAKARFNQIYLKGSRPLAVYKKHANKILTKHRVIVLHAMTAAINKAVQLHLWLMQEFPYLKPEIVTDSVPTIVGEGEAAQINQKSAIHITLTKQ